MELDPIDEKIDAINKKSIKVALGVALIAGTFMATLGPFTGEFGTILSTIIISIATFNAIYQILFRTIGRDIFEEAKKRKKYLLSDELTPYQPAIYREDNRSSLTKFEIYGRYS